MRKFKATWIFAIIVLLVGAYAFFGEYQKTVKEQQEKESANIIFNVGKDAIQSVDINPVDMEQIHIEKSEDGWRLTKPMGDRADNGAVDTFLNTITAERFSAVAKEGPGIDWAEYGLDKPTSEISVQTTSGQKHSLKISAKKNFEGAVFLRKNDEERVLVGEAVWHDLGKYKSVTLRDRRVYRGTTADINVLQIKAPFGNVKIQKKDGFWIDTSDAKIEVDQNRVHEILTALSDLRAEDFVMVGRNPSSKERASFFLTKPMVEIRLKAKNEAWLVEMGENPERETYALTSTPLRVLKLPTGSLDKFRNINSMDLRERKSAFQFDSESVTQINWSNELKSSELRKEQNNWDLSPSNPEISINSEKVQDIIGQVKNAGVYVYISANDQRKFKAINTLEFLDNKSQSVFKLQWSEPVTVTINKQPRNLTLVKTSRSDEVFAMENGWVAGVNLNQILQRPEVATEKPIEESSKQ